MTTRGRIVKPPRRHSHFEMKNRAKSAYKEDEHTQDPLSVFTSFLAVFHGFSVGGAAGQRIPFGAAMYAGQDSEYDNKTDFLR